MDADTPVSELFYELVHFVARKADVAPIPRGLHSGAIDATWTYAFNASGETVRHNGAALQPWTFVLTRCGFPAGMVNPFGGMLIGIADGAPGATEDALIATLRASAREAA